MVSINELVSEGATRPALRDFRGGSRTLRMDVVLLEDNVRAARVSRPLGFSEARAWSVLHSDSSRRESSLQKRRRTILDLPSFFYCFSLLLLNPLTHCLKSSSTLPPVFTFLPRRRAEGRDARRGSRPQTCVRMRPAEAESPERPSAGNLLSASLSNSPDDQCEPPQVVQRRGDGKRDAHRKPFPAVSGGCGGPCEGTEGRGSG